MEEAKEKNLRKTRENPLRKFLQEMIKFDAEMEQLKKITGDKKFHKIWKKVKKQHQKKSDNLN